MHSHLHLKLATEAISNADLITSVHVHGLHSTDDPFIDPKLPHGPPDDFPADPVECLLEVDECHVEVLVYCHVFLLQLSNHKYGICCTPAGNKA